ncbi:hypothetical protein ACFY8B_32135 [Streptomyces sp. NPDC012751]|uniref:hypothetical protein n=1 Tax=Streptomyces sp. NPDC012751 TaxID=3364846 RepID=UPI0036C4D51C
MGLPDEDLSTSCACLTDEFLISVDWTSHHTPATVALTHEGIRLMEEQEEGREDRAKPEEAPPDD